MIQIVELAAKFPWCALACHVGVQGKVSGSRTIHVQSRASRTVCGLASCTACAVQRHQGVTAMSLRQLSTDLLARPAAPYCSLRVSDNRVPTVPDIGAHAT